MSDEVERRLPGWTLVKRAFGESSIDTASPTPLWKDQTGQLDLARIGAPAQNRYRLQFADLIRVDVQIPKRTIVEQPIRADVAPSTREHFLADQVLPRLLGHLGHLVLHAGAVRIGEEAILLLGKSGSGKSTLAASFDAGGWPLLGDDAVIISQLNDRPCAAAVYPSLRLFPDSVEQLYPEAVPTAAMADYSPKLRISVPARDGRESGALPIRAIFALGAAGPDARIEVRGKSMATTCMALIENSFLLDPTDADGAPKRLHDASALARQVPAFDLCYPRAYSRLGDVRAAILEALDEPA